jgi:hypothetical protein
MIRALLAHLSHADSTGRALTGLQKGRVIADLAGLLAVTMAGSGGFASAAVSSADTSAPRLPL